MKPIILTFLFIAVAYAQPTGTIAFTPTDPTGNPCGQQNVQMKTPDGTIYTCQSGHMAAVGGGGTPGGSSGQMQVNSSNSFAGQSSIFSGGTLVQRAVECAHGTVGYASLTTAASSQEITIQTGISGNVVYDQILVSPSIAFTGGSATLPTVSMGRTGANNYEMTGALVPIGSGSTFWSARPNPPQLTSTYNIVLNFAVATGNVNAFTAGSLDWRICGYAAQ